ncbi:hypothetical protein JHK84_047883 [Glycine max]|nr:hypothetical protein JHK86_047860 [Glycine max]KAG4943824.1 hypothetical protein JHK85_048470 [Glycine max]KAG5102914.1 hypothetical protein JHK84_047883 [Glycine max]
MGETYLELFSDNGQPIFWETELLNWLSLNLVYEFLGDNNVNEGEEETPCVMAVMRCFDRAKIYVKVGDEGNDVVAFRREKYVPMGGHRGRRREGWDVYVELLAIAVIIFGVWMSTHHDGCRKSLTVPVIGLGAIAMAAQLIHDRVVMECLEGVWETLKGKERCQFRGTIRVTATSLVHPEQPARTFQQSVEWILPTPTPYRLVEPVQLIEVSSSEEDLEEDPEELPPEPAMDAPDLPEGDEDPLLDVDSPEDIMSASEVDSTEESGPGGTANSDDSSS